MSYFVLPNHGGAGRPVASLRTRNEVESFGRPNSLQANLSHGAPYSNRDNATFNKKAPVAVRLRLVY